MDCSSGASHCSQKFDDPNPLYRRAQIKFNLFMKGLIKGLEKEEMPWKSMREERE
jgi:hypothetical protein